jgi:hypothetical protein
MNTICHTCKRPILPTHRWKVEYRKFLFFRWHAITHRDCDRPEANLQFTTRPIPGRGFSDLFAPSEEELARSIHEDGKA